MNSPLPALIASQCEVTSLSDARYIISPDDWAMAYWLMASTSKSSNTERSYRKEVLRWRAFLSVLHDQDGSNPRGDFMVRATYEDVLKYIEWIELPDDHVEAKDIPPQVAVRFGMTPKQSKKPKPSPIVVRHAVIVMHGMYEELCNAAVPDSKPVVMVCESNPFKPFRKRFKRTPGMTRAASGPESVGVGKALSDEAWDAAWAAACAVPDDASALLRLQIARRRLIMAMLRSTWERRHAVAGILWSDFQADSSGGWSVRRERKGKGSIWAPVPSAVMDEVARFRKVMGRPALATTDELPRSVFWIGGRSAGHCGPVTDQTVYRAVKEVFDLAAAEMRDLDKPAIAEQLQRTGSGPHTIRHTMATQFMRAGGEPRRAQKILGHSSIAVTTGTYDTLSVSEEREALEIQWQHVSKAKAQ